MDERKTHVGVGVVPEVEEPSPSPLIEASPYAALHAVTPVTKAPAETFSRHFLGISVRRAFRLHIKTDEVLPSERAHLEAQAQHIRDPDQQAFLAWRRSVLLLIAIMFVPLTVSRFLESFEGPPLPPVGRAFMLLPAFAEAAFCVVAFHQLKNWAQWKKQRRIMLIAWALYFVAPFVLYLYPFRSAFDHTYYAAKAAIQFTLPGVNVNRNTLHMMVGMAFGMKAMMLLGPKIISLMPGMIRASIVTKAQFPGTTAPGWLMMLAAPLYALFAYIIVLLPYQITGSWEFLVGNAGILVAQVFIGISGRRLTVPLTAKESHDRIHKSWMAYIAILVVSAVFMVYGLADFIRELHLGMVSVVTTVLGVASNVLLDTLIGTDAIIAAMAHFRRRETPDPQHEHLLREAEVKLETFCR